VKKFFLSLKKFALYILRRERIDSDRVFPLPEERRKSTSIGWIFSSEELPEDPPLLSKGRGFFKVVFGRDHLPEEFE
jgi:hypothetical protein